MRKSIKYLWPKLFWPVAFPAQTLSNSAYLAACASSGRTFASLLNLANIWRPWSGLPFEGIHLWYCVLLKPTLSCPLFIKFTQDKVNRVKYKHNKDFFKLFSYQLLFKLFLEPNIFSAAGFFYIWPDLCSMVRTISATIVFSGKTICQKLHLLRKNTCQKCKKLVYVIKTVEAKKYGWK